MALRVVFFGNSGSVFTSRHFQSLLESDAGLVAVVDAPAGRQTTSNPLPAGRVNFVRVARERGIPAFDPPSPNEEGFIAALAALEGDLFLAVGYPLILKSPLLAVPRRLAANFHASLLPRYRGKHPVFWTLRGSERWAGLTVHVMDSGIDTGDILYQVKVRTRRDDTVARLYGRIMDRSEPLVGRLLADLESGSLKPRPQSREEGTYFSSIRETDFLLDWSWPAEKLRRHIVMTPGKCYTDLQGRPVHFLNAGTFRPAEETAPGELLWLKRTRAGWATGNGGLWSSRVLIEGRTHSLAGLCRELGLKPGDQLI